MGRDSFLSRGSAPWRDISFEGGVFEKNRRWGAPPSNPCSSHYGKTLEDLKLLGGILKKYNVEIPEVN